MGISFEITGYLKKSIDALISKPQKPYLWFFNNLAAKSTVDYIKRNHLKIDVISGDLRYNYMCHKNSVHDAISNKDSYVAMCVYIRNENPTIHFINVREGVFIDNTLGVWSVQNDYYLIDMIAQSDFFSIDSIFRNYRNRLNKRLGLIIRMFKTIYF